MIPTPPVILALATERHEALWRHLLKALDLDIGALTLQCELGPGLHAERRASVPGALLVADLAALHDDDLSVSEFTTWLARELPTLRLLLTHGKKLAVTTAERAWARANGAIDLIPRLATTDCDATILPALRLINDALGRPAPDQDRIRAIVRTLGNSNLDGHQLDFDSDPGGELTAACQGKSIDVPDLIHELRNADGVSVTNRKYRLKTYRNCFIGTEAVDWLAKRFALPRDRAVRIGQALAARGAFHHVVREQPFEDAHYFYRFEGVESAAESIGLVELIQAMRSTGGPEIKTRSFRGTSYPDCFVATEAVDWIAKRHGLGREAAESVGQRLVDLYVIHHVVDQHEFVDGFYFYRFYEDEGRRERG